MKAVEIHCDGASKGNPGRGGWGAILRYGKAEKEIFGGVAVATNNEMEITAALQAISSLTQPCSVTVHTDSQYVVNAMSKWLKGWKAKQWKKADGKAVANSELLKALDAAIVAGGHDVRWQWVRGHNGNADNERADRLANRGAYSQPFIPMKERLHEHQSTGLGVRGL